MKRIAVLVDFYEIDSAYSLCNVASDQIRMLLRAGYHPRVLVDEFFNKDLAPYPWNEVELFKLPSIPRSNRWELPENWQNHLERMTNAIREGLTDIDVVMTHDLIFQPAQVLYNWAARKVSEERTGSIWFLNLIHSATSPFLVNQTEDYMRIVSMKFPNSFVCFPNEYSRPRVAHNFGYEINDVKFTPHAIDYCDFFGFHEMSTKIVEKYHLLERDVIMCYPLRLDRGKGPEWLLRIAAGIKQFGRSVAVLLAIFHSTGGDKVIFKNELREYGHKLGLSEEELIFTCDFDESLAVRCPREMVRDFMILSNCFVLPSRSESFSLVTLEAGLAGNLIVLNHDFPPLRFWGDENIFAKFSSNIDAMTGMNGDTNVSYSPSPENYGKDIAGKIIYGLQHDVGLHMKTKLRQQYNLDHIWKTYWEPLLYAGDFK